MEAVRNIAGRKTIVMIAHRLSTVRESDMIVFLQQGRVLATGSFDELMASSREFRALAEAS
jgi:ABC-type multidrug transport system fused ATPase/permease subunit